MIIILTVKLSMIVRPGYGVTNDSCKGPRLVHGSGYI